MQTYVILDLEWNQSPVGKAGAVPGLPFEIIEIGAVKLDKDLNKIGEFSRVIRPVVYKQIHFHVSEIVHIGVDELRKKGEPFAEAAKDFLDWCREDGSEPVFCTWGEMDLTQLERNMKYHNMDIRFPYPFLYYDVQKLYGKKYGTSRFMSPLEKAARELGVGDPEEYHRALNDAETTGKILNEMGLEGIKDFFSLDYFSIPRSSEDEIYLMFPGYTKYVSRPFRCRDDIFRDRTASSMVCPVCSHLLKKRINWFSSNQKQYHCICSCPEHGFVKGKIRIKKSENGELFAVKTIKCVDPGRAEMVRTMRSSVSEKNRRKRKKA